VSLDLSFIDGIIRATYRKSNAIASGLIFALSADDWPSINPALPVTKYFISLLPGYSFLPGSYYLFPKPDNVRDMLNNVSHGDRH